MFRVLPLILVVAAAACSKTPAQASGTEAAQATPAAAAAPKPVPAQLPEVLAHVNGEAINKAEFEKAVQNMEARAGGPVPADQRDSVYRDLLDQLIGYKLLTQETKSAQGDGARRRGRRPHQPDSRSVPLGRCLQADARAAAS